MGSRGIGVVLSIVLTVYSASKSGRSLLYGLNGAFRAKRRRGFRARRVTSVPIALAVAALAMMLVAVSASTFLAVLRLNCRSCKRAAAYHPGQRPWS